MAGIVLKVNPDSLKAKAQEIEGQINRMESYWRQMSQLIQNSKGYWVGDASESHQKYKREVEEDVQKVIKRMREHPEDLLKMADLYEKTESNVVGLTQTLPDDVII